MRRLVTVLIIIGMLLFNKADIWAKNLKGKFSAGVNVSGIIPEDDEFKEGIYIGGSFDYGLTEYMALGIESGYHSEEFKDKGVDFGDVKAIPVFADLIFRYPMGEESIFNPYTLAGLGAIFWDIEESSTFKANGITFKIDPALALKLAGGIDIFVTEHIALNFEAGYIWSKAKGETKQNGVIISKDKGSINYGQVGAGVKYFF